ncbi:sensor histidine kinase [Microvirga sp. CF3016]|uniref:sensor histidine kinase n=1 Tax=Microvirga sp. CF3016 TaxID=3110181 RepID=UPI002E77ABB9|nr:sensor histidine kinase [Microvirga sp. CF3016]MEE1610351.1 sensor histidine kinase [Microvirga sp. CF3016]
MKDCLHSLSERALILAPHGRDAAVAANILQSVGITAEICPDMPALVREIARGAGFALVTDEAFRTTDLKDLSRWLSDQPPWSDFAFVLLTLRGGGIERNPALARLSEVLGNVVFLERPFHPGTLVSVARSALRGRRRQYEARARLEDLHRGEERLRAGLDKEKRAAEHQRLLIDELNHRVKNTLATVQSISAQTLRTSDTKDDARDALERRLLALSRAHDVLTRESWDGADLVEVVEKALEPYQISGENRFYIAGPHVRVTPRMSLALAMALHELATNAVKYGALSNKTGTIHVSWTVQNGAAPPVLNLRWTEAGGPPVVSPRRRGFGSRLIERSLANDLDGQVDIAFAPTGVVCTVQAPVV